MWQYLVRWSILLLFILVSCSDSMVNEPYDELDIRVKAYRALCTTLQLDTLGYDVIMVTEGDSLRDGFHWPAALRVHPAPLIDILGQMLPLRVIGIDAVRSENENGQAPPYITVDTEEPVIPAFTKTVERIDESHLVIVCGVYLPRRLSAYGACSVAHIQGSWTVTDMQFYYLWVRS